MFYLHNLITIIWYRISWQKFIKAYKRYRGKVSILRGSSINNCERKESDTNMCLIKNGCLTKWGCFVGVWWRAKLTKERWTHQTNCWLTSCIKNREEQLRRTTDDLRTRVAKCTEVGGGILESSSWTVTDLSFLCNKFVA
jgi:hypothetical protein